MATRSAKVSKRKVSAKKKAPAKKGAETAPAAPAEKEPAPPAAAAVMPSPAPARDRFVEELLGPVAEEEQLVDQVDELQDPEELLGRAAAALETEGERKPGDGAVRLSIAYSLLALGTIAHARADFQEEE